MTIESGSSTKSVRKEVDDCNILNGIPSEDITNIYVLYRSGMIDIRCRFQSKVEKCKN